MTNDSQTLSCNFCGKNRDQVEKLIAGPDVYICNECIELSYKITIDEKQEEFDSETLDDLLTPAEIYAKLTEYIIGHNDVKELLSVSAYNHYKRIAFNKSEEFEVDNIDKSNIILVGDTGTGKTLFAKTLSKVLNVPFTIADATTLTEAGYVGEDVESVIERLLNQCNWDISMAEKGIVFIDEIDKKARSSESNTNTKDISGEGVQQALLRLIEGTIVKVPLSNPTARRNDFVEVDTTNILFVCSGAFVGINKTVEARVKKQSVGFNSKLKNKDDKEWQDQIEHEDLITYGLIPELVGRLPNLVTLNDLREDHMVQILKDSNASIIPQVQKLLEFDELEVSFEDSYFRDVAKIAKSKKTGARGLKSIVENSLLSIMFRSPELKDLGVVEIKFRQYPTKNIDTYPLFIYNNGNEVVDTEYKIKLRG